MNSNTRKGHKITVVLAMLAMALFIAIFAKSLSLNSNTVSSPLIGKPAKSFQVKMLQGAQTLLGHDAESLDLKDLKDTPVILNFWASWCSTCAEESRVYEKFFKEHGMEGVKIIGLAVHDQADSVRSAIKSLGKSYPVALDEEGRIALNYGVTGVPETVFINSQGIVVHKELGPVSPKLLEQYLAELKRPIVPTL